MDLGFGIAATIESVLSVDESRVSVLRTENENQVALDSDRGSFSSVTTCEENATAIFAHSDQAMNEGSLPLQK